MKLRGAGEYLGTRQSGIAEMKIANLARDVALMAEARKDALELLKSDEYEGTLLAEIVAEKLRLLNS